MFEQTKRILKEIGCDTYELTEVKKTVWEFYFIRHKLDQNRMVETRELNATLYRSMDDGKLLGSASGSISPTADDAEIIRLGTLMIRTQCVTMFAHVWVMIINGLFQALGRALPAAFLGLSRQAICLIPTVIVLSLLFGVNGLAVSQASADLLSMVIAVPMVIKITREIRRLAETEEVTEDDPA